MMINSKLDGHKWKSAPYHWLPTEGRVPNACVGGFGHQVISVVKTVTELSLKRHYVFIDQGVPSPN